MTTNAEREGAKGIERSVGRVGGAGGAALAEGGAGGAEITSTEATGASTRFGAALCATTAGVADGATAGG